MQKNLDVKQSSTKTYQSSKTNWWKIVIITVLISFFTSTVVGFSVGGFTADVVVPYFREKLGRVNLKGVEIPGVTEKVTTREEESQTIDAVAKVRPSVVSIVVTKDLEKIYKEYRSPFGDNFEFFFGPGFRFESPDLPKGEQEIGGGSGFIISKDGLILTNKHVISEKDAEYTVITNEGKEYKAKILAEDPVIDIAILKIEANNLTPVELGDSDSLKIGQTVIAIGNSLGQYENSVTKGIVSGTGRDITAGDLFGQRTEFLENVIQTDAPINPGNSGGPLINLSGQVVGINTAIDQAGQSIGFAIPINIAKDDIETVIKEGRIIKPFLGVRYILINESIAEKNQLPTDYGALVIKGNQKDELAVVPGSPADKAGIVENDIILEINGQKIDKDRSLSSLINQYKVGDEVEIKILHDGVEKTVRVKLEERK